MAAYSTYGMTGDAYLDGILSGYKWATDTLTYSFPTSGSFYDGYGHGAEPFNNFEVLNATQQAAATKVLGMFSSVADIGFSLMTETPTGHADMRFGMSDTVSTAWAYYPSSHPLGGDSWYRNSGGTYDNPVSGNYAFQTFLHEVGHAMGLKHPHDGFSMPADRDAMEWTVMSYRSSIAADGYGYVNEEWGYAQTLMLFDIAALQYMYGANFTTYGGNTTYTWNPNTGEMCIDGVGQGAPGGNRIFQTVWDGDGTDTYDFSSYATNLTVSLKPGEWTITSAAQLAMLDWHSNRAVGNIANAFQYKGDVRSLIEIAIGGSGNDTIAGNQANNTLEGGVGRDTLTGGAGDDLIDGGNGNDTAVYSGSRLDYSVTLRDDGSFDVIDLRSGEPDGPDILRSIEFIRFADRVYSADEFGGPVPPSDDPIVIPPPPPAGRKVTGTSGNDSISTTAIKSALRTGEGADTISAGAGNDTIRAAGGNDIINGGVGKDVIYGDAGDDIIRVYGSDGLSDAVRAGETGEASGDTLELMSSKVTLAGFSASISQVENLKGNGREILGSLSSDTFDLRGFTSVSKLASLDAGKGNDKVYGSRFVDVIHGGDGNDTLYGMAGNDKLYGGAGSNRIYGGDGNDAVYGGSGAESVYGDAGNDYVKAGSGNDSIYGGHGNDRLYGDAGNDRLYGDNGSDTLYGGAGSDIFVFRKDATGASIDRVMDFGDKAGNEDVISLSGIVKVSSRSFAAWKKTYVKQVGSDTVISYDDDKIVLTKVKVATLDYMDFLF